MNQHSHPEATAAVVVAGEASPPRLPEPQAGYRCHGCDGHMPTAKAWCRYCDDYMPAYLGDGEPVPMSPAVAELAAIYAGHAIVREQAALTVRRQAAIVNLCADILGRVGRAGK